MTRIELLRRWVDRVARPVIALQKRSEDGPLLFFAAWLVFLSTVWVLLPMYAVLDLVEWLNKPARWRPNGVIR